VLKKIVKKFSVLILGLDPERSRVGVSGYGVFELFRGGVGEQNMVGDEERDLDEFFREKMFKINALFDYFHFFIQKLRRIWRNQRRIKGIKWYIYGYK